MKYSADPLPSPAKGILLTPGTGAARRKTVSFGEFLREEQVKRPPTEDASLSSPHGLHHEPQSMDGSPSKPKAERTRSLSRTLFKSKKISPKTHGLPPKHKVTTTPTLCSNATEGIADSGPAETESAEAIGDITVDLSQPRSRSGHYWKSEFEQYHKRSGREMKQVLQQGQRVKSYALRKDAEASSLQEKLQSETSKGAAMERRVTELATELARLRSKESELGSDAEEELVNDLAKHALFAAKSKSKVERYKAAIDEGHTNVARVRQNNKRARNSQSREDLKTLEDAASAASKRAARLEADNNTLKARIEQLKQEMSENEDRRKAREANLREAATIAMAGKDQCEADLAQLHRDYQHLQSMSQQVNNATAALLPNKHHGVRPLAKTPADPMLQDILDQGQYWDVGSSQEYPPRRKENRSPKQRLPRAPVPSLHSESETNKISSQRPPRRRSPSPYRPSSSPAKPSITPSQRTQPFVEPFSAFPKTFRRPKSQLIQPASCQDTTGPKASVAQNSSGFDIWDLTASPENSRPTSQQQGIPAMTGPYKDNKSKPLQELSRNVSSLSPPDQQPSVPKEPTKPSTTMSKRATAEPIMNSIDQVETLGPSMLSLTSDNVPRRISSISASVGVGEKKSLPPDRAKAARERLKRREVERKERGLSSQIGE